MIVMMILVVISMGRTNGYAELMAKSSVSSIINSERNYLSNGAGLGEGTNL